MALDGCGQMCKCILILFNIAFGLLGSALLALGLFLRFSSQTRGLFDINLNTQAFVIGVIVLMVVGAFLLLTAIFGDYGACSENRSALAVFSGLLGVLAGVVICAGVMAFTNSDEVAESLSDFYGSVYLQYVNKGGDPTMEVTLKIFHNCFQCCGVGGVIEPFVRSTCTESGILDFLKSKPCPAVIVSTFRSKAPLVLGIFLGTAALMLLAIVCSVILRRAISRSLSGPPYLLMSSASVLSPAVPLSGHVQGYTPYPAYPAAEALADDP
ncbi:CD9 antigen-like isoform X1 [Megalops cyprinoides]|uniref:CD9 antigen-like isoform X1 n=1 Tax=Megalops cyprinoides TaxID=118141 RepID=UPI0018642378|nr:CD9 antigen-like isoform X1 [Megalops cyprinoides]